MAKQIRMSCLGLMACLGCLAQDVMTRPADEQPFQRGVRLQFSAKIVMEDGTPPPPEMQVWGYGCAIGDVFGNGTVTFGLFDQQTTEHTHRTPMCTVWVTAPGVRSQYITLRDGMQVALIRLGAHEGSMISMTVLKAPPPAKKAYTKGAEALQKKKYPEARKQFEQAVKLYPDYALAWSELGALLAKLGLPDEARAAFKEAIRSDRMYLKPLVQLAAFEAGQDRWPECIKAADAALALHPIEFPGAYYYRALAHLRAGEWDQAITLSDKATQLDTRLEYPRAYLVLASALEKRGERRAAADVLERFLSANPLPEDADRARAYLARLAQ